MVVFGLAAIELRRQLADVAAMLIALANAARTFLLPHWRRWHEAWGPPAPDALSQWTCVRSSLLLVRAIERSGTRAVLRSGKPDHASRKHYGLLTSNGWASHAWVEAESLVIDVTADQFGYSPVIVTSSQDPVYRAAEDEPSQLKATPSGIAAVDEIWGSWCRYADHQYQLTGMGRSGAKD